MESLPDQVRFSQFVNWTIPITVVFGLGEGAAALVFREPAFAAAGAVTLLYGGCLLVARRYLQRGELKSAVLISCIGLLMGIILVAPAIPIAIPALTILPLVVVALALPYLSGAAMRLLIWSAWIVGAGTAALTFILPAGSTTLPAWFTVSFQVSSMTAALGLASLLLWQYTNRIEEAAAETRQAEEERERSVSELRKGEARVHESENRFRSLFRQVPVALWENDFSEVQAGLQDLKAAGVEDFESYFDERPDEVLRLAGCVKTHGVNDRTLTLFGANDKETLQQHLPVIFGRSSSVVFRDLLVALANGARQYQSDVVLRSLTGEKRTVDLRLSVPTGNEDSLARVLMSTMDLSTRIQAEELRRRNSARALALAELSASIWETGQDYRQLLETAAQTVSRQIGEGCVIRLLSEDGHWLELAAAHHPDAEFLGRLRGTQVSRRLPISEGIDGWVVASGQPISLPEAIAESGAAGIPDEVREHLERLNLRSAVIAPLRSQGRVLGTLSVFRTISADPYPEADREFIQDVADRLGLAITNDRLYEETQRANEELEERVALRTAQLESINAELEAFTYSVSHDLRGPLRHTAGYIELLQRHAAEELDPKSRRYLKIISEEALRMGELIDDLLEFSRMGNTQLRQGRFATGSLVREIIREFEPELVDRRVRWEIGTLPEVFGDRAMLRLVWVNLVANALKYSRTRGEAEITIGCSRNAEEHRFFIRDNGVGFNMKYVGKLFGIFQRLHNRGEFEGTGIGLANVQRIIHRHGGRVWAEAAEDAGATFFFTLPAVNQGEGDHDRT